MQKRMERGMVMMFSINDIAKRLTRQSAHRETPPRFPQPGNVDASDEPKIRGQ